jgi:aryl-alcohol dehydrogenase-like predicted oxidoreductase
MTLGFPSGAEIPRVILGTSRLGSVFPDWLTPGSVEAGAFRILDEALAVGCSALDIAASYQVGGTERVIGKWMRERRNRDALYLISKGGHPIPVIRPNRLSPEDITADLHASLRRLRTDRLDLYLLHRDHPDAALESLLQVLSDHQRSGKIRAWGVSNWGHSRIEELDSLAGRSKVPGVVASSPHYSLVEWERVPWKGCVSIAGEANRAAREYYTRSQMPVLAYSPLGRGFLSRSGDPGHQRRDPIYGSAKNVAKKQRADILAHRRGVSTAEVALAYLFSQPFPVYAIVGASSAAHLEKCLGATRLRLEQDELHWLETGEEGVAGGESRAWRS